MIYFLMLYLIIAIIVMAVCLKSISHTVEERRKTMGLRQIVIGVLAGLFWPVTAIYLLIMLML